MGKKKQQKNQLLLVTLHAVDTYGRINIMEYTNVVTILGSIQ